MAVERLIRKGGQFTIYYGLFQNDTTVTVVSAAFTSSINYLAAHFDASASVGAATYTWDFGDGSAPVTSTSPTIDYTYSTAGTRTVTLTVTAADNSTDSTTGSITATVQPATFTLGVTKPLGTSINSTTGNVGTGVVRAAPTGSAGTKSGNQTVAAGATLQGWLIDGDVTVSGNAKLLDCIVKGRVTLTGFSAVVENNDIMGADNTTYAGQDTALVYCNISGTGTANEVRYNRIHGRFVGTGASAFGLNGVRQNNIHTYRNEIYNVIDGEDVAAYAKGGANNFTTEGNHIHDLIKLVTSQPGNQSHNDGTQIHGGSDSIRFEGNYYNTTLSSLSQGTFATDPYQYLSALMVNHDYGPVNLIVKNNWFDYSQEHINDHDNNTYASPGVAPSGVTISVTGNRFDMTHTTGYAAGINTATNLTWTGNVNQAGATINPTRV